MTTKPKPLTRAQRRARKPGETTGRKQLPPEKRRVQRTVSLDYVDDVELRVIASQRSQTVSQVIESITRKYLAEIKPVDTFQRFMKSVIGGEK